MGENRSRVRIADPQMMLSAAPQMSPALQQVAEDARTRMQRVVAGLSQLPPNHPGV